MFNQKTLFLLIIFKLNLNFYYCQVAIYGQCGGIGYSGSTTCVSGSTCFVQNKYYSQCLTSCPVGWLCVGNLIFNSNFNII